MCGRWAIRWLARNKKTRHGFEWMCSWAEVSPGQAGIRKGDAPFATGRDGAQGKCDGSWRAQRYRACSREQRRQLPARAGVEFVRAVRRHGRARIRRTGKPSGDRNHSEAFRDAQADATLAVFGKQIEGVSDVSNRLASAIRLAN